MGMKLDLVFGQMSIGARIHSQLKIQQPLFAHKSAQALAREPAIHQTEEEDLAWREELTVI
jgi:hypothetical protein